MVVDGDELDASFAELLHCLNDRGYHVTAFFRGHVPESLASDRIFPQVHGSALVTSVVTDRLSDAVFRVSDDALQARLDKSERERKVLKWHAGPGPHEPTRCECGRPAPQARRFEKAVVNPKCAACFRATWTKEKRTNFWRSGRRGQGDGASDAPRQVCLV